MFRSTWYVAVRARVHPAADRGRGGAQLEEGRLLEEDERLGRGDAHARGGTVENRGRAERAPEAGGRGRGERQDVRRGGHQEKDLGTSGTPENGGRSGDEMRPCTAARR